jgi:hypothetical protein
MRFLTSLNVRTSGEYEFGMKLRIILVTSAGSVDLEIRKLKVTNLDLSCYKISFQSSLVCCL